MASKMEKKSSANPKPKHTITTRSKIDGGDVSLRSNVSTCHRQKRSFTFRSSTFGRGELIRAFPRATKKHKTTETKEKEEKIVEKSEEHKKPKATPSAIYFITVNTPVSDSRNAEQIQHLKIVNPLEVTVTRRWATTMNQFFKEDRITGLKSLTIKCNVTARSFFLKSFPKVEFLSNLTYIDISGCNLQGKQIKRIMNTIQKATQLNHLETLDISLNCFGDEGIESVVTMLQHSPHMTSLQKLSTWGNEVTIHGLQLLTNGLKHATHLTRLKRLDIYTNKFSISDILQHLTPVIAQYEHLQGLVVKASV